MNLNNVVDEVIEYRQFLERMVPQLKYTNDSIMKHKPSVTRDYYEKVYKVMNNKDIEFVNALGQINEVIANLEQIKVIIAQLQEITHNNKIELNNSKIGTLEGLARQQIIQLGIQPTTRQEAEVMSQTYNEPKRKSKKGGKTKRKSSKNKKTLRK